MVFPVTIAKPRHVMNPFLQCNKKKGGLRERKKERGVDDGIQQLLKCQKLPPQRTFTPSFTYIADITDLSSYFKIDMVQLRTGGSASSLILSGEINPLFASLSFGLGASKPNTLVREKRTGADFPAEYCPIRKSLGGSGCRQLAGMPGVRTKKLAGIKNIDVYALAFYIDESSTKRSLQGKFRNSSPDSLQKDQKLFNELMLAESLPKVLRIVITSGLVKKGNFLDALNDRMKPALQKINGDVDVLNQFSRQFDEAKFRRNLEIVFTCEGGKLSTVIDGKDVGTIKSKDLTKALLDVYLGGNPVSKDAKLSFGQGLAEMVLN